jgi:hypothetical protein
MKAINKYGVSIGTEVIYINPFGCKSHYKVVKISEKSVWIRNINSPETFEGTRESWNTFNHTVESPTATLINK